MINAFLSYRHKNESAITARNKLEELCDNSKEITLVYDEDVTESGDNLVVFMQDLVDARCVFLFLDPDYFKSGYTLFELISINEQEGFDARFVHAVRVTDDMSTYVRTRAKNDWLANEEVRNEAARLLVKTGRLKESEQSNHDAIWRRIDDAWSKLIENPLDHLKYAAIKDGEPTQTLSDCVDRVVPTIVEVKQSQSVALREHIEKQIAEVLNKNTIPLKELIDELDDPKGEMRESAESVASYLAHGKLPVSDILSALICVLEERKIELGEGSEEWDNCCLSGEQLAGWLLLMSVNDDWWFDNEHTLTAKSKESMLDQFPLDTKEFVEVVISRSLMQRAKYRVNKHGELEPHNLKSTSMMVYDASSEGANETQFLIDIYKDLYKKTPRDKLSTDSLLDMVLTRAGNYKKNAKGKAIYYLVSAETKALLDSFEWYKGSKAKFEGCLHFICCEPPTKVYENSATNEGQKALLDQVAILLSLNED